MTEYNPKLTEAISRSDAVIFDFGGVLYKSTPEIQRIFGIAGATIGQRFVPELRNDFESALRLCLQSHRECGYGTRVFAQMADVDPDVIRQAFHRQVAQTLKLEDCKLSEALDSFILPRALLTQSAWGLVTSGLEQIGIRRHFSDKVIYSSDNTPAKKSDSPEAVRHVLDRQGWSAARTIMVDDTPVNLYHAKKLGVNTVLVASETHQFPGVDCAIPCTSEFLEVTAREWHPLRMDRNSGFYGALSR